MYRDTNHNSSSKFSDIDSAPAPFGLCSLCKILKVMFRLTTDVEFRVSHADPLTSWYINLR